MVNAWAKACFQDNLCTWDSQKHEYIAVFRKKNERVRMFLRIAGVRSTEQSGIINITQFSSVTALYAVYAYKAYVVA